MLNRWKARVYWSFKADSLAHRCSFPFDTLGEYFFQKNPFFTEPPQEKRLLLKERQKSSWTWCPAVEPARCWSQQKAKPQLLPDRSVCSNASLFWRDNLGAKKLFFPFFLITSFVHPCSSWTAQLDNLWLSLSFWEWTWLPHPNFIQRKIFLIVKVWKYNPDIPFLKQTKLLAAR